MTPLLFAAYEKLGKEDFASVLRLVSVLTFRHTIVGHRNPNELESAYHNAAKNLLSGHARTPKQVFEFLRNIYVSDRDFEADFTRLELRTSGQSKRLAKYTLCRLESDLSGRECDYETDPATVEHVLPENPSQVWEDTFPLSRQVEFTYRVGNLSLLEATTNRALGNESFVAKVEAYPQSRYLLTRRLAEDAPEEWTPAAVEARQKRLAKRAVHVWRENFGSK